MTTFAEQLLADVTQAILAGEWTVIRGLPVAQIPTWAVRVTQELACHSRRVVTVTVRHTEASCLERPCTCAVLDLEFQLDTERL